MDYPAVAYIGGAGPRRHLRILAPLVELGLTLVGPPRAAYTGVVSAFLRRSPLVLALAVGPACIVFEYPTDTDSGGPGDAPTDIEPTGADNDPTEGCPCAQGTELIYALSDQGTLLSFDPVDLTFAHVADVACGGMHDTFSMGVSRKGRAWIQYSSGDLFTVDINEPGDPIDCKDPGFSSGHPQFPHFGMAFVGNSESDPCDKLYVHSCIAPDLVGPDVGALGVVDPQTLELSTIAPLDYAWGELAGTPSGRLFAFEGSSPPFLAEYDKMTGEMLEALPLPELSPGVASAFAGWGGDFYFFTAGEVDVGSSVWHLDYDASDGNGQALTLLAPHAPGRIVGAGVSTCAPPDAGSVTSGP